MKTRLLKRLRKEAKMLYKIKRIDGKYCIYEKISTDASVFSYIYLYSMSYKCLKDAQNMCTILRRKYILRKVNCLREEQDIFIDF